VSAVLLAALFIIAGTALFSEVSRQGLEKAESKQLFFRADREETNLNALLQAEEPESGLPMSVMLGKALMSRGRLVNYGDKSINVTKHFKELLDYSYGEGNYYFELSVPFILLNLNFVIDGSGSLAEEREALREVLPRIINLSRSLLPEEGKVVSHVFILSDENLCSTYQELDRAIPWFSCRSIGFKELYEVPEPLWDNISPPSFGYASFQEWNESRHFLQAEEFFSADWAAGSAYASYTYFSNPLLNSVPGLNIIFPISDELSTSSIASSCFTSRDDEYSLVCSLCEDSCTNGDAVARSHRIVRNAISLFQKTLDIVNPIYSFECDLNYSWIVDRYTPGNRWGSPSPTWCESPNCAGCSGARPNACYQPNCNIHVQSQMEELARATHGVALNLGGNLNALESKLREALQRNMEDNKYLITIGARKEDESRYSALRRIPLPNNFFATAKLWVYEERT